MFPSKETWSGPAGSLTVITPAATFHVHVRWWPHATRSTRSSEIVTEAALLSVKLNP